MIQLIKVNKSFYNTSVLKELTMLVPNATIFGLIGPNGSGKSTILRLIAGIYHADGGYIKVDGQSIYENILLKQQVMLVSDEPYFLSQSTLAEMRRFYKIYYPTFSDKTYHQLLEIFPIKEKSKLHRFSKGMRQQAALILALSINSKYLLLDEAFDGLDPSMRYTLKQFLQKNVLEFGQTVIISSNNLMELTNICDSIGMIYDGRLIISGSQNELTSTIHKYQLAFKTIKTINDFPTLDIVNFTNQGSIIQMIVKGDKSVIEQYINTLKPLIVDNIPINLEEFYIYESRKLNDE